MENLSGNKFLLNPFSVISENTNTVSPKSPQESFLWTPPFYYIAANKEKKENLSDGSEICQ